MPYSERDVQELVTATNNVLAENDDLKSKIAILETELSTLRPQLAEFEKLLEALSDERGTLLVLQRIAHDEQVPLAIRVKAAGLAVGYERPRVSVTAHTNGVDLFAVLETRRMEKRLPKVIEHQPDSPSAA
jgi:hypothetical protein